MNQRPIGWRDMWTGVYVCLAVLAVVGVVVVAVGGIKLAGGS